MRLYSSNSRVKFRKLLYFIFFVSFSFTSLAKNKVASENLDSETKKVINEIYFNSLEDKQASDEPQRLTIDKLPEIEYETTEVEVKDPQAAPFDISIKTLGEVGRKRFQISSDAFNKLVNGEYESAIFLYQKLIDEFGENDDVNAAIGVAYHRLGDYHSAKEYYSKTLLSDPHNEVALNNFMVLVGEEAPEEGIQELEKIARVSDEYAVAAQLGYLYGLQGNYDESIKYFEIAAKYNLAGEVNNEGNAKILYNLAISYDKAGREEDARIVYKKILDDYKYLSDNSIPINDIRSRYNKLSFKKVKDNAKSKL